MIERRSGNPSETPGRLAAIILVAVLVLLLCAGCDDPVTDKLDATRAAAPAAPDGSVNPDKNKAFTADQAAHFVQLALDCAVQEYPNKIGHTMQSDADQGTPRSLHPAFFGCFDWHSSVHGHWLLARFARLYPEHRLATEARAVLDINLSPDNIAVEVAYLMAEGRASWERPYGLAWLLQLAMELREWQSEGGAYAARWVADLAPLENACVLRLSDWMPKLAYPIRTGEHSQTAFAFGLMLDHARAAKDTSFADLIEKTTLRLYSPDTDSDLRYEPSGQDFLSPILAEADLMRRVMKPKAFARWFGEFLTSVPHRAQTDWLPTAVVTDRSDGKLAHLDGLNLSRAWMLEGIASGLPAKDPRRPALEAAAWAHRQAGLAAVTGEHYEGGHWLGTYAMYLSSERGLGARNNRPNMQ